MREMAFAAMLPLLVGATTDRVTRPSQLMNITVDYVPAAAAVVEHAQPVFRWVVSAAAR